jgi:tagatose-6-phosphate ketose/aldose isomerase
MFGMTNAQFDGAGASWTAKEIRQQPELWVQIAGEIAGETARLEAFLSPLLRKPDLRILMSGAGTSAYIGECLAPALTRTLRRRVDAVSTTDLVGDPASHLERDTPTLVVSFARSGNSPESVAALEIANTGIKQTSHLIFTCDASGALYRWAGSTSNALAIRLPERCNDRSFAMTSSFTGMLLAAACAFRTIPVSGERAAALAPMSRHIVADRLSLLQQLVSQSFERVVYLGAKEFKGLARESALKMLELTDGRVVAIAETPLAFRHGPKTIVNRDTVIVVFIGNDPYTRQYDIDLLNELRRDAIASRVIALSTAPTTPQHPDNIVLEAAADANDVELCLPYVTFAQSLALLRAISLGVRPDNPNEAGAVNRVVKGVSIHPWASRA